MSKVVFLDRDGVINQDSPEYIKSPEEWEPIPGSIEAIVRLQSAGYSVFIATNQSGIGRGFYSAATLERMHQKMQTYILDAGGRMLDGIYYCPHLPTEDCECRKPKPGMLLTASREHALELENAYFVGDSHKDLMAAAAAGVKGVLVLTGNGSQALQKSQHPRDKVFDDLAGFSRWLSS